MRRRRWIGWAWCLFSLGLTLILLAITYLSYGLSSFVEGLAFMFVGSILLLVFIKIESSTASPLLDFRLFQNKLFAMANIAQLLNALVWGGVVLLLAFYLQIGLGYSPLQAGVGIMPLDVTYLIFSLVGGKLSDKYPSRTLCTLGLLIMAPSFFFMSTFASTTNYAASRSSSSLSWESETVCSLAPNLKAIMYPVPADRIGIASAFRNTLFNVGFTASYGLIILFLTFGIPYETLSLLLQKR